VEHTESNNVHSNGSNVAINKTNYTRDSNERTYGGQQMEIRRGDIWMVNMGTPVKGSSIQGGIRPFIVTSNILNNKYCPNINGCALTSQLDKPRLPVHIMIEGFGLKKTSVVLVETLCPINKNTQLLSYVGHVDDEEIMSKIQQAINIQNGELKPKTTFERLSYDIQNAIHVKLKDLRDLDMMINRMEKGNCSDKRFLNLCINDRENIVNGLLYFCEQYKLSYNELYTKYKESDIRVAI
jgi:mRNA interferase MazF